MKITEKNGYAIVSEFDSAEELRNIYTEKSVVVFMPEKPFDADVDFIKNLPYITILACETLQGYAPETVMSFDMRLSEEPYFMRNNAEYLEKYKKICGLYSSYRYENTPETDNFQTDLVRILSGDFLNAVDEYLVKILDNKPDYQIKAIASCFIVARNGNGKDVLNEESRQFYKLIMKKSEA